MPYMSQEQIDEIEFVTAELIEQLNKALKWKEKYLELKFEIERIKTEYPDVV